MTCSANVILNIFVVAIVNIEAKQASDQNSAAAIRTLIRSSLEILNKLLKLQIIGFAGFDHY